MTESTIYIAPFGSEDRIPIKISLNSTVEELRKIAAEQTHQPDDNFHLLFRGKVLSSGTLSENQIEDGHIIFVSHFVPRPQNDPVEEPRSQQRIRSPHITIFQAQRIRAEQNNIHQIRLLADEQLSLNKFLSMTNSLLSKISTSQEPLDLNELRSYVEKLHRQNRQISSVTFSLPIPGDHPSAQFSQNLNPTFEPIELINNIMSSITGQPTFTTSPPTPSPPN